MSAAGRLAQHAVCTYLQARLLCVPSLRAVSCQARVALQWAAVRFHCILPPTPHRPPCCHHMQQYSGETYSGPACRYHLRITLEGTPGTAAQLASELRRRGLCRVYFSMCSNLRTKIMCFGECTPAGGGGEEAVHTGRGGGRHWQRRCTPLLAIHHLLPWHFLSRWLRHHAWGLLAPDPPAAGCQCKGMSCVRVCVSVCVSLCVCKFDNHLLTAGCATAACYAWHHSAAA